MSQWQPIATCPQGYDGKRWTYVLFYGFSKGKSFDHPVCISGWMDSDQRPVYYYSYKLTITHWMTHPDPPEGPIQGGP